MGKTNEPPLPTLADVYDTDAKQIILDSGENIWMEDVKFADSGRLFCRVVGYTGDYHIPKYSLWAESADKKIRYIFPVTYEPPPLDPGTIIPLERGEGWWAWFKKLLRVK